VTDREHGMPVPIDERPPAFEASAHPGVPSDDEGPTAVELDMTTALTVLGSGSIEIVGRIVTSSNNALFGTVSLRLPGSDPATALAGVRSPDLPGGTVGLPCVYKPLRGERPLWDFPDGTLARREVAAFVLSEATGWSLVPPTVFREGPFGPGMVQLWLDPDETIDPVALVVDGDPRLRRMALFDVVANNADRKIGHLLPMPDGHVYGVDHGICFHVEPKLRTVLWNWRGLRLREEELEVLRSLRASLAGSLGDGLARLLDADEVAATARRIDELLTTERYPQPDPDRPAIPWPPY